MPPSLKEIDGFSTGSLKVRVMGWLPLSIGIIAALFIGALVSPDVLAAASPSQGQIRNKRRTARAIDRSKSTGSSTRAIGNGWEIRASTGRGETYTDCVFYRDEKITCRFGGYTQGVISRDGSKLLLLSPGSIFNPKYDKAADIFDAQSGKKVFGLPSTSIGIMAMAANPESDRFILSHQLEGSTLVEAFDFSGKRLWQRELPNQRAHSGGESIAIAKGGKSILVATTGNPRGKDLGRVFVLNGDGSVRREIGVESARIVGGKAGDRFAVWNRGRVEVYSSSTDSILAREVCDSKSRIRCQLSGISADEKRIGIIRLREGDFRKKERARIIQADFIDLDSGDIQTAQIDEEIEDVVDSRLLDSKGIEVETAETAIKYEITE